MVFTLFSLIHIYTYSSFSLTICILGYSTWSRGTNLLLPFAVSVTLNPSIAGQGVAKRTFW